MSNFDPGVLAFALEDLHDELTQWSVAAGETVRHARYTQRQAAETLDQALHYAAIVQDLAFSDESDVYQADGDVQKLLGECRIAAQLGQQTLSRAQQFLQTAISTLRTWREQLQQARAWLKRAEARLAKAIEDLQSAQQAVAAAEYQLSRAKSDYKACKEKPPIWGCGGARAAVDRAAIALQMAEQMLVAAIAEVEAAKLEVEQAKARVACCERAVKHAEQAEKIAKDALENAKQAATAAERSVEHAEAAERLVQRAEKLSSDETQAAREMMNEVCTAEQYTENAHDQLRQGESASESAQRNCRDAQHEINYRVQSLRKLNRASLV